MIAIFCRVTGSRSVLNPCTNGRNENPFWSQNLII